MKRTRVLNQEKCLECEKIGTWAKGLCQAHYSKMRRKTPEGKLGLKLYNDTKGKLAHERYKSKKPPKPPKPPKDIKICECGKVAIAKNMCRNCYQNKYDNENYVYKPREKKTVSYDDVFKKVLQEVMKGNTIQNACRLQGMNSTGTFYRKITPIQKKEINAYKKIGKSLDIDNHEETVW